MNRKEEFFNPFNGYKCMVYVNDWKRMLKDKKLLPPITLTVDLSNKCQLSCIWCHSKKVIEKNNLMSNKIVDSIITLTKERFFKSITIAGGGEPLFAKNFSRLVNNVDKDCKLGVITNGINIDIFNEELLKCKWIGVSIDAATEKTYGELKGVNYFNKVIKNIEYLVKKGHNNITYKFLIWPKNIHEIYNAAKLAKDLGLHNFFCRPADYPWFNTKNVPLFSKEEVKDINIQIEKCKALRDDNYNAFVVTQKFNENLVRKNDFNNCWAGLFECVIYPDGNISICCDRRGDKSVILCTIDNITKIWGSKYHFDMLKNIDVKKCPKCTYRIQNVVFENLVLEDKMYCDHF